MLKLPLVTLVACGSSKYRDSIKESMNKSSDLVDFADEILVIDDKIDSSDNYSKFVLFELDKFVKTPFALVVQNDSGVLRPEMWTDEFLKYDYIGAPWTPNTHFTKNGIEVRVGNGGFSLRSKKLLTAFNEYNLPFIDNGTGFFHEDGLICNYYREFLESKGFLFAPVDVAAQFSHEIDCPETVPSFGYHRYK